MNTYMTEADAIADMCSVCSSTYCKTHCKSLEKIYVNQHGGIVINDYRYVCSKTFDFNHKRPCDIVYRRRW